VVARRAEPTLSWRRVALRDVGVADPILVGHTDDQRGALDGGLEDGPDQELLVADQEGDAFAGDYYSSWRQLGLTEFWQTHLPAGREEVSWEKVLQLLVVNRLLEPGSEFRVHRHWFVESAMDALLESDFAVAGKDRLYRCLDRIVAPRQDLFVWLKQKWAELFHTLKCCSTI